MGTFDPNTFLDQQITESNSTSFTPVPEGEYTAVVDGDPTPTEWKSRDGSKSGIRLDVNWSIDDDKVKEALGRDKVTVRQGIMLDLNPQGGLDTGKGRNITLGRLREAVGLNAPGKPFSFRQLNGQVARISISHRVEGDAIYADVKGVAKL